MLLLLLILLLSYFRVIYNPFNPYPNWASLIHVLYSHLINVVVFPIDGMWSQLTDDPPCLLSSRCTRRSECEGRRTGASRIGRGLSTRSCTRSGCCSSSSSFRSAPSLSPTATSAARCGRWRRTMRGCGQNGQSGLHPPPVLSLKWGCLVLKAMVSAPKSEAFCP